MTVNKYYFKIPENNLGLQIPLEIKWDFYGRSDSVEKYEEEVIEDIIGVAQDFEILRFSHNSDPISSKTQVKYNFHFFSGSTIVSSTPNNWVTSYIAEGFLGEEIYYYTKPFTKSFFKLDFYDSPNSKTQTNYFTVILPVQQGSTEPFVISPYMPIANIRKPEYTLDYVGDKEGFFLYWLRKQKFLDISTFYCSAKFFDGKLGVYVKMTNEPQSNLPNYFIFNEEDYFYYRYELDIDTKTYEVFKGSTRVGTPTTQPINWYEYVNP